MKKYLRLIFLLIGTLMVMTACDNGKSSSTSFKMGNPYVKEFAGLKGPVKSVEYTYYIKGEPTKRTLLDYSPDGALTQMKAYENDDSVIFHYNYDPNNNIQEVTGSGICFYKNKYQKGNLVKEWFYTNKNKEEGYTLRYKIEKEILIKKENDIATGAGITTTYTYYNNGVVLEKQQMQNNGAYTLNQYDSEGKLTTIEHYSPKAKFLYKEDVKCRYDVHGNSTRYVSHKGKKLVEMYRAKYKYYTDKELKNAKKRAESTITSSNMGDEDTYKANTPTSALMTAIVIISLLAFITYLLLLNKYLHLFSNFGGKVEENGMRKMWMYNSEPYVKMSLIFTSGIAAFLSSIALLLLVGGITWMVFSLVKLMLWAIIILGWVLLVGGVLVLIFVKKAPGLAAIIVGLVILCFKDHLEHCGEKFAEWGGDFLDNVNALDWTLSIFNEYGIVILLVIAVPIGSFLTLASLLILIDGTLRIIELTSLKIYNVHRPCPYCGNNKNFTYMVNGDEYPIPLHPGLYGVLHQTNHFTGVRVPTMLLCGKAKLTRMCPNCHSLINTTQEKTYGTDIHVGIVGNRSSGKTYMLFRGMEILAHQLGKDFYQIDADASNQMENIIRRIHQHEGVQTAVKSRYKAIQFRLNRKLRPLPYHLFFYDVAGEKFSTNVAKTLSAMEFYKNVRSVLFVIDPTMIDLQKVSPSPAFTQWSQAHGNPNEEYDLEATIATLQEIFGQVGRKTQEIDLIVTCTKKDLGYLQNSQYPYECSEEQVKRFITEELGLYNLDNALNNSFKTVGYAVVSAIDESSPALGDLFLRVLKQRGVNQL